MSQERKTGCVIAVNNCVITLSAALSLALTKHPASIESDDSEYNTRPLKIGFGPGPAASLHLLSSFAKTSFRSLC